MYTIISERDKNKRNIVYLVTIYTGSYLKEFHYIGLTSQTLEQRFKQHLTKKDSAVYQFVNDPYNEVCSIRIEPIATSELNGMDLDFLESRAIYEYIGKRGWKGTKRNRLINKQWKGADHFTLKRLIELSQLKIA